MNKREPPSKGEKKEEKENMPAVLEEAKNARAGFSEFISKNKEKITRIALANTKKNKDGKTVITKDDPCRRDTEWD